jgi:hypothetical protein
LNGKNLAHTSQAPPPSVRVKLAKKTILLHHDAAGLELYKNERLRVKDDGQKLIAMSIADY